MTSRERVRTALAHRAPDRLPLALVGQFGGGIFEQAWYMRGLERWMEDLLLNPQFAGALLDRISAVQTRIDVRCIQEAGQYLETVNIGDDLGIQSGPLISVAAFDRFVKPVLARRCSAIHAAFNKTNSMGKIVYHSCGDTYPFLRGLIEAGVDVLDPVQATAAEMDPRRLKEQFGAQIAFHGAIDTQHVLPFGTPEDVRAEVRQKISTLGANGGYVAAPVHNVQGDVPVQNLLALTGAVREFGCYPLP